MADGLKAALFGGPIARVSNARKDEIVLEVLRQYGLIEPDEPEPVPEPPALPAPPRPAVRSGFVELDPAPQQAPKPWPDSELASTPIEPPTGPPAWPPVLEGEFLDDVFPGFSIKIDRGKGT